MRHGLNGSHMPGSTQQKFLLAKSGISLYSLLGSLAHKKKGREGRTEYVFNAAPLLRPLTQVHTQASGQDLRAYPGPPLPLAIGTSLDICLSRQKGGTRGRVLCALFTGQPRSEQP